MCATARFWFGDYFVPRQLQPGTQPPYVSTSSLTLILHSISSPHHNQYFIFQVSDTQVSPTVQCLLLLNLSSLKLPVLVMYPNRYIYFMGVPVLCCITDCLISGFNNSFIFVRRLPYWLFIFCSVIHTTYFLGLLSCDSLVNFCSATFCLVCLFSSFHQRALLSSN